MPTVRIPLAGPAYAENSPRLNPQRCINLYPVASGPGGSATGALYRTPGMAAVADLGGSPVRGMHLFGNHLYCVVGDRLWRMLESGTVAEVTTSTMRLATTQGRVAMAENGQVLLMVDGTCGYLWNGAALTTISDAAFPGVGGGFGPTQAVFLKSYFVVNDPNNAGRFYVSNSYVTDAAAFVGGGGTAWATAESHPDPLLALAAHGPYLWLLGRDSTEVWYPSGGVVPFDPVGGREAGIGCAAPWSVARTADSLFWLARGQDGGLAVMRGATTIRPVSTPPIVQALEENRASAPTATAFTYAEDGHSFYQLNIGRRSLVYDLTGEMWHERGAWDTDNAGYTRHAADMQVAFGARNLVGHHGAGRILELSRSHVDEDGQPLRWERVTPALSAEGRRMFFRRLSLDLETGLAGPNTPRPQVMLSWSDDGGHTWSANRHLPLGAAGRYGLRIAAHRLGSAHSRVFRIAGSDPVPVALLDAWAEIVVTP
ncbi:MAG: hypothetical protein OEW11_07860 [Nitrospirota bacterium]|nr:hypothetical protein [Nitrospirota bacterium]